MEAALEALPGSTFGIEARDDISDYLEELALSLGGRPLSLRSEDKALYHATVVTMGGVLKSQSKGPSRSASILARRPALRMPLMRCGTIRPTS